MSAHVLLNLLNELGKRDKMRGLPSILSLFRNEFRNELSNDIKITSKSHFWRKNVILLSLCTGRCYGRHYVPNNLQTIIGLSILMLGVISLPDASSYDK